jgi:hypothetical protein
MALSRAAAAAARKAARNRGLQGNRAEDGSLTTLEDIGFTAGKEGREMRAAGYHDKTNYEALADAELKKVYDEATERVESLEERMMVDRKELENLPDSEYSRQIEAEYDRAKETLNRIEAEMDDRGIVNRDMMIYQEDIDEAAGRYT